MSKFIINGGRSLKGTYRAVGNKNAVLPMLAACVLTDQEVRLRNVPVIEDVQTMLEMLEDLGVSVSHRGSSVTLCAKGLRKSRLTPELCRKARSSILFAGPLSARHGRATLFPPGGDVIGKRRLDTHFAGLRQLGIRVSGTDFFTFKCKSLRGAKILLDEASVTATENIVMASVLARGKTTVFNAACEPHVQDLCVMLNKMGARISGIGTNYLTIEGVSSLKGVTHRVETDYIDAASFIAASAVTGGKIKVEGVPERQLDVLARPFNKLGVKWTVRNRRLSLLPIKKLKVQNDHGSAIPKVEDGIWPAFPSDLMSAMIVLATQAEGTMLFFEKLFESRMYFVDRLIEMGARVVQCDPHRVIVTGPAQLHGIRLSSPDIRAGMALIIAALCARGQSIIENAHVIDRGYERIDQNLRKLGADITRVEE